MSQILIKVLKEYVEDVQKNLDHFNKWVRAYPFYNNVKNEGVELYAA